MKRFVRLVNQRISGLKLILLGVAICTVSGIHAQNNRSVSGRMIDEKSNQPVPFGNVALVSISDSTLLTCAMGSGDGVFKISPVPEGNYRLLATYIGYQPTSKNIYIGNSGNTDAGTFFLHESVIVLEESQVTGDRLKAKSEKGKTTYFITKKMLDAVATGTELLKLIPGIQIDLMQNISLEGGQNILIFVDGKERDRSFISQLNPGQIEKVEVTSVPPSNYDGNITGVLNILLKKERDSGISGQIYSEIPTSGSEVFMSPTYSLNYGIKKWNLFTSYNGEMTYLNIQENNNRKVWKNSDGSEIISNQYVRQRDWSHKFHYGFDYFLSTHDQLNFYAFYNPYSRELSGTADAQILGIINRNWQAIKVDMDRNASASYSLYFKHTFAKNGSEITFDISNYNLKAKNSTDYIYEGSENRMVTQTNAVKPGQNITSIKMDYTSLPGNKLNFSSGVKAKYRFLHDSYSDDFFYHERIVAVYGTVGYQHSNFDLSLGLRTENSVSDLKNNSSKSLTSWLPYALFRYKLTSRQNIELSYNHSVNRPNIYQLIPFTTIDDPYTVSKGNPFLNPELQRNFFLEHSVQFKSNYFSSRLFYTRMSDVISNLTFVNDTGAVENHMNNMGTICKYGLQFSGSLKLGIATINPYLQLFNQSTVGNDLAKQYAIKNRNGLALESGLSAILSFKKELSLSFTFQYATPKNEIQGNSYCDALYFVSLEKTFNQNIKIGLVSGIPFAKSFVYKGSDIEGSNFSGHYQGNVKMSAIPVWFKISYQFNSGKKRDKMNHTKDEIDLLPKKGF